MNWDYLIVTASNSLQASAYEAQLRLRRERGLLSGVREAVVVPDLEGKRIGSGGSTLQCLKDVLQREGGSDAPEETLRRLRILIIHAGGDSRRLPAYGPCGKIFVPVPGESGNSVPAALFDRLAKSFLQLPPGAPGKGQIVVAAGDALVQFDPAALRFDRPGITVAGGYATPEEASRHGVYVMGPEHSVTLYLQKPSLDEQRSFGAINQAGQAALDVGIMSLDACAAAQLLDAFRNVPREGLLDHGVDLYREICCALGTSATLDHYERSARGSGSTWPSDVFAGLFPGLRTIPFYVELLPDAGFLHFGSTKQLVESGLALLKQDGMPRPAEGTLVVNSLVAGKGGVSGADSWVEGCRMAAPLELAGRNVVIGLDVDRPLALPKDACIDILSGTNRQGLTVSFVRCYGVRDTFKDSVERGGTLCGRLLLDWLSAAGVRPEEIWPDSAGDRSLWNARVFPAELEASHFRRWLWMYAPETATEEQKRAYRAADRYSASEIALVADQGAFHERRLAIRESSR